MRAARSMAAMGIATPIPIFDPVFNAPELAEEEFVLVEDALALVGACAELADDGFVLICDVLGPVGACAELVELERGIVELVVVRGSEDAIDVAIGMGL